jgi:nucleoporin POM152
VSKPQQFSFLDIIAPFSLGLIKNSYLGRDQHLLGQHTVRMSPISTAQLNPDTSTYCLAQSPGYVLLPILLNNTHVAGLKYSTSPLNAPTEKTFIDVTAKHLEQTRQEHLQLTTTTSSPPATDYEDEYDDEGEDDGPTMNQSKLQKSQSLVYLRISRPGVIRLEAVWDGIRNEARLVQPSEVVVVPCPSVTFVDAAGQDDAVRCVGQDNNMDLMISVNGVPPLSLRWLKTINGKKNQFLVEGIEGPRYSDSFVEGSSGSQLVMKPNHAPQSIKIPLAISLNEPGTHLYALEEIVDGQGNVMFVVSQAGSNEGGVVSKTETTRSFLVLRQPLVSFGNCNSQHPKPLLIGSETQLTMAMQVADAFDAPWEISLQYRPPQESLDGSKVDPKLKPWGKRLKAQGHKDELVLRATTPGEYTITGIKGKVHMFLNANLSLLIGYCSIVLGKCLHLIHVQLLRGLYLPLKLSGNAFTNGKHYLA